VTPLLLVHGGGCGAWCWERMLPHLESGAVAVDLPPRTVRGRKATEADVPELSTLTLADFATSVLADADAAGYERFVLVGHSLGGLTISEVARRVPDRVAALVYVSCMVPPEGGSSVDALPDGVREYARTALAEAMAGGPNPIGGLDDLMAREMFCNDMDEEQTRFVLDYIGTEVAAVMAEAISRQGVPPTTPKTYVKLLRDQSLPPNHQDILIANLQASPGGSVDVVELDAGHMAMVSRPRELAEILDRVAKAA
jgi:pimeloyl-ACP methyl ester carboxylesterase